MRPAKPMHVALYLTHICHDRKKRGPIKEACDAINWNHVIHNLPSPTKTSFVEKVKHCAMRSCVRVVNRKDPIEACEVAELVRLADLSCLAEVRFLTMVLLSFFGFMRISETRSIQVSKLRFFDGNVTAHLGESKTDVHREGEFIYIAASGKPTCPVAMLKRYTWPWQILTQASTLSSSAG